MRLILTAFSLNPNQSIPNQSIPKLSSIDYYAAFNAGHGPLNTMSLSRRPPNLGPLTNTTHELGNHSKGAIGNSLRTTWQTLALSNIKGVVWDYFNSHVTSDVVSSEGPNKAVSILAPCLPVLISVPTFQDDSARKYKVFDTCPLIACDQTAVL